MMTIFWQQQWRVIVSVLLLGDKDLLVLKQFQGIDILSPGDFQARERIE